MITILDHHHLISNVQILTHFDPLFWRSYDLLISGIKLKNLRFMKYERWISSVMSLLFPRIPHTPHVSLQYQTLYITKLLLLFRISQTDCSLCLRTMSVHVHQCYWYGLLSGDGKSVEMNRHLSGFFLLKRSVETKN